MRDDDPTADLRRHLCLTLGLDAGAAERVLGEIMSYFDETPEAFVRRRHHELRAQMVPNTVAFERIRAELEQVRFRAPALSERQVRRLIYG